MTSYSLEHLNLHWEEASTQETTPITVEMEDYRSFFTQDNDFFFIVLNGEKDNNLRDILWTGQ